MSSQNQNKQTQNLSMCHENFSKFLEKLSKGHLKFAFKKLNNSTSIHIFINVSKLRIICTSASLFSTFDKPLVKSHGLLIKYEGCTRNQILQILKTIDPLSIKYSAQGIVSDTISAVRTIVSLMKSVKQVEEFIKSNGYALENFIMRISALLLECFEIRFDNLSITTVCAKLIEIFCLFRDAVSLKNNFKVLDNEFPIVEYHKYKAQGFTQVALATLISLLPDSLAKIINRMNMLSSAKVLDDMSNLYSLYEGICDFLIGAIDYLPFKLPESFLKVFKGVLGYGNMGNVRKMKEYLDSWKKDKRLMIEPNFRENIKRLFVDIKNDSMVEWQRKSQALNNLVLSFTNLHSAVLSYENTSRVEPVCFVFEGPPGCMKSVQMDRVIKSLGKSAYAHITKPTSEGKDFYDSYNNEEVFYTDDMGQQGISQWRNIINIVSSTKLPLDCAEVSLKDTKYFNSKIVLVTTNHFMNIRGLNATDGIADINALHRRAYVFDFTQVRRTGNVLSGIIQFKHFDMGLKKFISDFPYDLKAYFNKLGYKKLESFLELNPFKPFQLLSWMRLIITTASDMKEHYYEDNTLSKDEIQEIVDGEDEFKGQSMTSFFHDIFSDLIDSITGIFKDLLSSISRPTCAQALCVGGIVAGSVLAWETFRRFTNYIAEADVQKIKSQSESMETLHSGIQKLKSQLFRCDFVTKTGSHIKGVVLASGRRLLTTSHATPKDCVSVIVYKDYDMNHRLLDNCAVKCIYRNTTSDVTVWSLPDYFSSPFKNISNFFSNCSFKEGSYLLTPMGAIQLSNFSTSPVSMPTKYAITINGEYITNFFTPVDYHYKIQAAGLCGSLVVGSQGEIMGMHVAGSKLTGKGVALRYPQELLITLGNLMNSATNYSNIDVSDKIKQDFSGIKLALDKCVSSPNKTNYIKSPLYGMLPEYSTRIPAPLNINGPHTVKDAAKKAFKPVVTVKQEEIDFGSKVLDSWIKPFDSIPMVEVIKGNKYLAPLNKDSSNGHNNPKNKEDCIDFEKGELKSEYLLKYQHFLKNVDEDNLTIDDELWKETTKDELLAHTKELPRSFRISPLQIQLLTKTLFGEFVSQTVRDRNKNNIMIGINPYKEWDDLFKKFQEGRTFAGDVKSWDGSMLPQVQHAISEVLLRKYKGLHINRMKFILANLIYNPVAVNDDVYITTHSMPSGSYLTAILNSWVNRFYTAMWYYREMKKNGLTPKLDDFNHSIADFVYGDDKVNVIYNVKYLSFLNAVTMRDFFESIGMGFTNSDKTPVIEPFHNLKDITFLKRSFRYHSQLGLVVAPLDLVTFCSTMSYVDKTKDFRDVMRDKIHMFQREAYLHENNYHGLCETLENWCKESGIPYVPLEEEYLKSLYLNEEIEYDYSFLGITSV